MTATNQVPGVRKYWHGGAPGLQVGDVLMSRIMQAQQPLQRVALAPRPFDEVTLHDRVYFSDNEDFARAYAYQHELATPSGTIVSRGTLYEVEPVGSIEEDEDFAGCAVSWCSPSAVITAVLDIDVRMRERDAVRAIGEYCTWDDGRPMYHPDGRLHVSRQMESFNISQEQLDAIVRPWTRWTLALERVQRAAALGQIGTTSLRGEHHG